MGDALNKEKLDELAEVEDMTIEQLLDSGSFDSVAKGICMNDGCNYTTDVEPDQSEGYCEKCGTNTVTSCLILADIL